MLVAVALLPVGLAVLFLGLRLVFHAVDPAEYGPAGSPSVFSYLTDMMAEFGFVVAAALGASAGTTDLTDGMFRHLVITGRSRLALYLARIPAGLAIVLPLAAAAYAMLCLVTSYAGTPDASSVALAGTTAATNPSVNEMIKIGLWLELDVGIGFLAGLGLGSLAGQRMVPTILLIVLQIIITPVLASHVIPYFLDGERLVVGIAIDQLRPAALWSGVSGGLIRPGGSGALLIPPMPTWAMVSVIAGWAVGWTGLGAWRMMTRDA